MNIAIYNEARAHYTATCNALKTHLARCTKCSVAPPLTAGGAYYCEQGRACLDEALRAQVNYEQALRDCVARTCSACD